MGKRTILSPDLQGVITVSGYRGLGKSTFASQADLPENIIFFDFENKGQMFHEQLNFGRYVSVSSIAHSALEAYAVIRSEIDGIKPDQYTVAVIDNVSLLEAALQAEVMENAVKYSKEYGVAASNIIKNAYGAMSGIVNNLIGDAICSRLHEKGVKLIIVTSHVKPVFQVDNKFNIKGASRWQDLSILSLVLIDGDFPPIPSALVMKEQLASNSVQDDLTDEQVAQMMRGEIPSHTTKRRLPYRLPKCDWQSIRHYLYHPADINNPAEGETPTLEETDPFSSKLSKEQIKVKLLQLENMKEIEAQQAEAEAKIARESEAEAARFAKDLASSGDPLPIIVSAMNRAIKNGEINYSKSVTIGDVAKWTHQ